MPPEDFQNQKTTDLSRPPIAVLGAGIVGVSCALELQRRGFQVTLFDRHQRVVETSYGNAGVLATSSVLPMNNARLWHSLWPMLTGRSAGLRYQRSYLLQNIRWFAGFMRYANKTADMQRVRALNPLVRESIRLHQQWLSEADMHSRLRSTGWLKLYRQSSSFAASAYERNCLQEAGVELQTLQSDEVHQLEPGLQQTYAQGVWVKDAFSVDNPAAVSEAYRQLFISAGGSFIEADICEIKKSAQDYQLQSSQGDTYTCNQLVITLGPWSNNLLSQLGYTLPVAYERGYHQHFDHQSATELQRPVHDVDGSFVLTPMEQGYRLTTGVELKDRDAPASPDQLQQVLPAARQAFPLEQPLDTPWLGCRPTLPDALPAIGRMSDTEKLWVATGHHHIGFSTGPASGRLLADLISGQQPSVPAAPFTPGRFK